MRDSNPIVCIQCSQEVQDPPVLNQDAQGKNCLICADRVLESMPQLLPRDSEGLATPRKLVLLRDEEPTDGWDPEPA